MSPDGHSISSCNDSSQEAHRADKGAVCRPCTERERTGRIQLLLLHTNREQFVVYHWDGFHIYMCLSPHPHFARFDGVLGDGRSSSPSPSASSQGGNTCARLDPRLKLKWRIQLLDVIDNLNLICEIQCSSAKTSRRESSSLPKDRRVDDQMSGEDGFPCRSESYARFLDERSDVRRAIFTLYEIIARNEPSRKVSWEH